MADKFISLDMKIGVDPLTRETWDFRLKNNGHIVCEQCVNSSLWCHHLERITRENLDQELIWDKPENAIRDDLEIQIPMFPSQNLWTHVALIETGGEFDRYSIEWLNSRTDEVEFIGWLNPSEGRNVIRYLLLEYMWGDRDRRKVCRAAHHGYKAEMEWQAAMRSSSLMVPYLWSVYHTGHCIVCLTTGASDTSDLVPGKENTGVWN